LKLGGIGIVKVSSIEPQLEVEISNQELRVKGWQPADEGDT
jgi:hypothetical protein